MILGDLSSSLAVRGAVSGGRGSGWLQLGQQKHVQPKWAVVPSLSPRLELGCILASHPGSIPVLQQLQPSQEQEAELSAYKVRKSPGWLGGLPMKALSLQNPSAALHSSF